MEAEPSLSEKSNDVRPGPRPDAEAQVRHVHTPVAAFVTRLALDRLRQKQNVQVVYTAHGFHFHPLNGFLRNTLFEALERRAANWTDFMVVMNRDDLKAAKGVDRAHYSQSAGTETDLHAFYRELGVPASAPLLLIVAEFTKRKRHTDAIRAFAKLKHPDVHLVLAGSGPLLEATKHLATKLDVAERVHFLGQRSDVPVLMKAARAVILPSSQEGLPRCVMEAMSMGVPVIGSRIRGTTELLERDAGLLVDVGNIDELARAMQRVLDDDALAAAMGDAGWRQSKAYDVTRILQLHEELYREALQRRNYQGHQCAEQSLTCA